MEGLECPVKPVETLESSIKVQNPFKEMVGLTLET